MTLAALIKRIEAHANSCGEYAVVAFPRIGPTGPRSPGEIYAIIKVYAPDRGHDILLQMQDKESHRTPKAARLTVNALLTALKRLRRARGRFNVECTWETPRARWRLDFPIAGTGVNDSARLFALVF